MRHSVPGCLGFALMLAGCDSPSLRDAKSWPVHVVTLPAGARCLITVSKETVVEIAATPADVRLPKSPLDGRMLCTLPGHRPLLAAIPAQPIAGAAGQAALAGAASGVVSQAIIQHTVNAQGAALGAATGLGMAYLTGALHVYQPVVNQALQPMPAAEKPGELAAMAARIRVFYDPVIASQKSMCPAGDFACETPIAAMIKARDTELAMLQALD